MKSYSIAIGAVVLGVSSTAFADPPLAAPGPSLSPTAPAHMPMVTHSRGLIAAGIVFLSAGTISSAVGTLFVITDRGGHTPGLGAVLIGLPLLVHGLGCVAAGIPMIAVGAKKIPAQSVSQRVPLRPSVSVGPTSAALAWTF